MKKQNSDDPSLIEMLPVMVKIGVKLLNDEGENKYKEFALNYRQWLRCKNEECVKCSKKNTLPKAQESNY